ncbi:hypothetical protein EVAR_21652_1 [Eumeta japonica]|uniref:Uncharacterized protein n=1 Tax=Eumeta variegata TaxID=151549 RepID=A0A4C1VGW9_EUMVA|nr:hypothetical protein EVAR_21652_1 [Eumeta japonica]
MGTRGFCRGPFLLLKEGSGNVEPAYCLIRRHFRGTEFRASYCGPSQMPLSGRAPAPSSGLSGFVYRKKESEQYNGRAVFENSPRADGAQFRRYDDVAARGGETARLSDLVGYQT